MNINSKKNPSTPDLASLSVQQPQDGHDQLLDDLAPSGQAEPTNNIRRSILARGLGALTAGALLPSTAHLMNTAHAAASAPPPKMALQDLQWGYINVADAPYYATGDGRTDDTAAIQNALNDVGNAGGGIVFMPTGTYYIATRLTVPAYTALVGVARSPWAWNDTLPYKGTTLLAVADAGNPNGNAFITLAGDNATVEGFTIFYPNQIKENPPRAYPWTIRGNGVNNTIQNMLLVNPYSAIDLATNPCGRHLVKGVYGQPLLQGITVDQCYDIGRIMDCHFWPFWTQDTNIINFQTNNAFVLSFFRTDWEVVQDVFAWGYHVGALFRASQNPAVQGSFAMNGQMTNINFDNVDVGLDIYDTQTPGVHVSNLNIANAGGGSNRIAIIGHPPDNLSKPGSARFVIRGASFWGSLNQGLLWQNNGYISLSDSIFQDWSSSQAAIEIQSGRAMISNNYFRDLVGTAINIGAGTDRVMVLGNELVGNKLVIHGNNVVNANNHA